MSTWTGSAVTHHGIIAMTEEQQAIVSTAKAFADEHVRPFAAQWDRDSHFEPSLVGKLGELGFLGMLLPEEYGGLGLDAKSYLLALEEIAAADASTAVMMSVHNSLPTQMLNTHGTDAQKRRFLTPLARGEMLGAFALSEADAGSDASAIRCQAVRDGNDWIVNGSKAWITSGTHAGVIIAMIRTDTPEDRRRSKGISAFILTPDLPGFHVGKKEDKLGMRASPTVTLNFDNMRVPADRMLGAEGMGFIYAMQSLVHGRLGIAAQAIGIARAAFEAAAAYANERKQFGTPIAEFQGVQFKLADMVTRITAARAMLHETASAKDAGAEVDAQASMCKLFASETAMWVTTNAIQIFGGYGYVKEYPVEKYFRDAKVTEIYEGTSEVQRIVIGRAVSASV
jgi:alkylation response protein AidB-like acyl-CoA dehydrogenase